MLLTLKGGPKKGGPKEDDGFVVGEPTDTAGSIHFDIA